MQGRSCLRLHRADRTRRVSSSPQALGHLGNWFNNELYGDPPLPWGLEIHQMGPATGGAAIGPDGNPIVIGYFQPTNLGS